VDAIFPIRKYHYAADRLNNTIHDNVKIVGRAVMTRRPAVLLIATMDTKADEALFIENCLLKEGVSVIILDPGIRGRPSCKVGVTRGRVARAAGKTLKEVRAVGNEARALNMMIPGAVKCAHSLYKEGKIDGIISLGGTMGTSIGTAIMRSFPFGIPKVMISTMASSNTRNFVGTKDIVMLHSVCDIAGLNRLTRSVLHNGALAVAGMVKGRKMAKVKEKPAVAISTLGTTDGCAGEVRKALEIEGYEVITFHTNGTGGRAMDEMINQMDIRGVVELSLNEIATHLFGGDFDAGPERGKSALKKRIPTVIAPGNIDFLVTGPMDEAKKRFPGKQLHSHNEAISAAWVERKEQEILARSLADTWNEAEGPIAIFIPLKGFSSYNSNKGPFYHPKTPQYFAASLKKALKKEISLNILPYHINDIEFANAIVEGFKKTEEMSSK
jgi:uncharacterized protein (UPF0261 family)